MDPQQRLLLEQGYQSLHHSLAAKALMGNNIGYYVGIFSVEFGQILANSPAGSSVYAATGSALSIASGRVSYVLGLQGPCVSVETAC